MTRYLFLIALGLVLTPPTSEAAVIALPEAATLALPDFEAAQSPAQVIPVKKKKKNKGPHMSGSVGTNGGKVKVKNDGTSLGVNSNGTVSASVKPKGSNVRLGINSKGKVRIGF